MATTGYYADSTAKARQAIVDELLGAGKMSGLLQLPGMDVSKPVVVSRCGRMIVGRGEGAFVIDPLQIGM